MKFASIKIAVLALLLVTATGCFRVSSETRALRDAALDNGAKGADEKIELALGRLTFAAANFGLGFVQTDEIPPEARLVLNSVKGAEVSVYKLRGFSGDLSAIMNAADKALDKRGCERLVGVINDKTLVAVYVPKKMRSPKDIKFSVLVLNEHDLVCASARGDVQTLMDVAWDKAREHLPPPAIAMNR
jgi:hypothetical protein